MKTDIIVIDYKAAQFVERLKKDLSSFSSMAYELHLWDNEGIQANLSILRNDLAAKGDGDFILFANPDICIAPDWDKRLAKRLDEIPAMAVCPKELVRSTVPTPEEMWDEQHTVGLDSRLTRLDGYDKFKRLAALFMRRETWQRLKGYDERFRFSGADRELCQRIEMFDGRTYLVHSCVFYHYGNFSRQAAAEDPTFDSDVEVRHKHDLLGKLYRKEIRRWHLMSDRERHEVRATPFYQTIGARP